MRAWVGGCLITCWTNITYQYDFNLPNRRIYYTLTECKYLKSDYWTLYYVKMQSICCVSFSEHRYITIFTYLLMIWMKIRYFRKKYWTLFIIILLVTLCSYTRWLLKNIHNYLLNSNSKLITYFNYPYLLMSFFWLGSVNPSSQNIHNTKQ